MTLYARLALAFVLMTALTGTHWKAYVTGKTHQRQADAEQQLNAQRAPAIAAINYANTTIEATYERAKTQQRITTDSLGLGRELDRLRRDLASARAAAQSASACTSDASAQDELLAAMESDIARLAEQGAEVATAADSHAADAVMCFSSR